MIIEISNPKGEAIAEISIPNFKDVRCITRLKNLKETDLKLDQFGDDEVVCLSLIDPDATYKSKRERLLPVENAIRYFEHHKVMAMLKPDEQSHINELIKYAKSYLNEDK